MERIASYKVENTRKKTKHMRGENEQGGAKKQPRYLP